VNTTARTKRTATTPAFFQPEMRRFVREFKYRHVGGIRRIDIDKKNSATTNIFALRKASVPDKKSRPKAQPRNARRLLSTLVVVRVGMGGGAC